MTLLLVWVQQGRNARTGARTDARRDVERGPGEAGIWLVLKRVVSRSSHIPWRVVSRSSHISWLIVVYELTLLNPAIYAEIGVIHE